MDVAAAAREAYAGTRPDSARKPVADNLPTPFHVYSMRQAIDGKFILDVPQSEIMNAIMGALDAHTAMSAQALNSEVVRAG